MLGWVIGWMLVAVSTGVVWEWAVNPPLRVGGVLARGAVVLVVVLLSSIVTLLVDFFGGIAQHAWDNYPWRVARTIVALAALIFLPITIAYLWLVAWLVKRMWPHVVSWFMDARWAMTIEPAASPGVQAWALLGAINAALLWLAVSGWRRDPLYAYRHSLDVLGLPRFVGGVCLMAYLRLLVPRRDFFVQAPIVSWMPILAGLVVMHEAIPIALFAVTTPLLVLMLVVPMWVGSVAPPLWMFLGTSELDSYRTFYGLRASWRRHGLTLLDRTSAGGLQFYRAWRASASASAPFYDPGIARIWSLRTRPGVWRTAVRLLAAFVPVIVVDWRRPSDIVRSEVDWLVGRKLVDKVYMVVSPEHGGTPEASIAGARFVDEATLFTLPWPRR